MISILMRSIGHETDVNGSFAQDQDINSANFAIDPHPNLSSKRPRDEMTSNSIFTSSNPMENQPLSLLDPIPPKRTKR
jgi:hypothetical protein